jgi:hypothetical protein
MEGFHDFAFVAVPKAAVSQHAIDIKDHQPNLFCAFGR